MFYHQTQLHSLLCHSSALNANKHHYVFEKFNQQHEQIHLITIQLNARIQGAIQDKRMLMKHTNMMAEKNINEFTTSLIFKTLEMQLEREVSFPTYPLTEVATAGAKDH